MADEVRFTLVSRTALYSGIRITRSAEAGVMNLSMGDLLVHLTEGQVSALHTALGHHLAAKDAALGSVSDATGVAA